MLSSFLEEDTLKKYSVWLLRNSIFNTAIESIDKPGKDQGIARYASANRLLTSEMEMGESLVRFAKKRAA